MPANRKPRGDGFRIGKLRTDLLERHRKDVGYQGEIDRNFYENYVWWWRPLIRILSKRDSSTGLPPTESWGFFPKETFEVIRCAEALRSIPELIREWQLRELGARVDGAYVGVWPAFNPTGDWMLRVKAQERLERRYVLRREVSIDLRKLDIELKAEFGNLLKQLREEIAPRNPFPLIGKRPQKNSQIKADSFSILEKIDEKFALKNSRIDHDQLGNARKMVADNRDFFSV